MTVADTRISPEPAAAMIRAAVMDRDPPDVALGRLDLSGVHAGADRKAEALSHIADGRRAPNCALGAIELGEHAVAGGLDHSSSMAIDRRRGLAILLSDEVAPPCGTKF